MLLCFFYPDEFPQPLKPRQMQFHPFYWHKQPLDFLLYSRTRKNYPIPSFHLRGMLFPVEFMKGIMTIEKMQNVPISEWLGWRGSVIYATFSEINLTLRNEWNGQGRINLWSFVFGSFWSRYPSFSPFVPAFSAAVNFLNTKILTLCQMPYQISGHFYNPDLDSWFHTRPYYSLLFIAYFSITFACLS